MSTKFTKIQKASCIIWFTELKDMEKVRENFLRTFCTHENAVIPSAKEIFRWYSNFKTNGTLENKTEHPVDIHTAIYEKQDGILNLFGNKIHKCHPYKMRLSEEHSEDDLVARKKFAEYQLQKIHTSLDNIWFGGSAKFYTNGRVECHNLVYMSEDPKNIEYKSALPRNTSYINVWAAINAHGIIGPYMSEELNQEKYRNRPKNSEF